MLHIRFQELNTPRLWLRRITPEDAPLFFSRLGSSETVTEYMLWKPHSSIEEAAASIQKALRRYETGESFRWAIALPESNEIIGIIDLMVRDQEAGLCSFAYMLAQDFWNTGYGTEALGAVIDYGFREWGLSVIEADHFAENPASGAVMRKVGMTYQQTIPKKYEKNGTLHDAHVYRITLADWQNHSKVSSSCDNS